MPLAWIAGAFLLGTAGGYAAGGAAAGSGPAARGWIGQTLEGSFSAVSKRNRFVPLMLSMIKIENVGNTLLVFRLYPERYSHEHFV